LLKQANLRFAEVLIEDGHEFGVYINNDILFEIARNKNCLFGYQIL